MKIFLSYRHDDSKDLVGRIYDQLTFEFGEPNVFRDLESMNYGDHIASELENILREIDVFVFVIGPTWAGDSGGRRRIEEADDWVRKEAEYAIESGAEIFPVLVRGASLKQKLPSSIMELANFKARRISSDEDFKRCTSFAANAGITSSRS